jgi:hypothetical protein
MLLLRAVAKSCGFGPHQTLPVPVPTDEDFHQVLEIYLLPGSQMELNIPPKMRNKALQSLAKDGSPANLRPIADHCFQLLKNCSHRNFVRIGVSNGTFKAVCAATAIGGLLTLGGFVFVLLRAFYPGRGEHVRWEVFIAWPMWWFGMGLLMSSLRGSCFFMLLLSRRHQLPWEQRVVDNNSDKTKPIVKRILNKLSPLEHKVRVKDLALRDLQHRIVIQSVVIGALFATAMTILFILLPVWK